MSTVLFKHNVGQSGLKETFVSRKELVDVAGEAKVRIRTDYTAITLPKAKRVEVQPVVVEVIEEAVEVIEETVEPQEQPHISVEVPRFKEQQEERRTYEEEHAYEDHTYENIDAEFNDVDDSEYYSNDGTYSEFRVSRSTRIEAAKNSPKLRHKVCMSLNLSPIAIDEAMEYAQTDMVKDIKQDVKKAIWNLIK